MSANAYKAVGYLVWKGGRWYLRQRLPRARALAVRGVVAGGALTAVALAARRLRG
ncbi:MAG TPA: hypothetical protein VGO14_01350 [Solirubrobacteraceae bacterium]|jgi:hypothetical protein|nr:hypothetical protein [Solirubrobacteraceae bacterium]